MNEVAIPNPNNLYSSNSKNYSKLVNVYKDGLETKAGPSRDRCMILWELDDFFVVLKERTSEPNQN